MTAPLQVAHHHSLNLLSEPEGWIAAHMKLTEKWSHRIKSPATTGGTRARRAEAELSATRLTAGAGRLIWEMRLDQLEERIAELEERNDEIETSTSWRIDRPAAEALRLCSGASPARPASRATWDDRDGTRRYRRARLPLTRPSRPSASTCADLVARERRLAALT